MSRPSSLGLWWATGLGLAGSVLTLPVGLLLLPVVAAGVILLTTRRGVWPEVVGAGLGVATGLAVIASLNRDSVPCPDAVGPLVLQPGTEFACGGVAPKPWLVAALVLASLSVAVYALALRQRSHRG